MNVILCKMYEYPFRGMKQKVKNDPRISHPSRLYLELFGLQLQTEGGGVVGMKQQVNNDPRVPPDCIWSFFGFSCKLKEAGTMNHDL